MTMISLTDYARQHNKDESAVRRMAQNGRFRTAQKIGRNWIIDDKETYPPRRKRMGKILTNDEMAAITAEERKAMLKVEQARKYSHIGECHDKYLASWERIPQGLIDALSPEQLGWVVDLLHIAYEDGQKAKQ